MSNNLIKVAGFVRESIVDGPGIRYVIFTQGCYHNCPGCHNPQTHDPKKGFQISTDEIFSEIKQNPLLQGITFSGGEPFLQASNLLNLAYQVKKIGLDIVTYTGYLFEDILYSKDDAQIKLLNATDILIDGKFVQNLKHEDLQFRGSSNQRIIDVKKSLNQGHVVQIDKFS